MRITQILPSHLIISILEASQLLEFLKSDLVKNEPLTLNFYNNTTNFNNFEHEIKNCGIIQTDRKRQFLSISLHSIRYSTSRKGDWRCCPIKTRSNKNIKDERKYQYEEMNVCKPTFCCFARTISPEYGQRLHGGLNVTQIWEMSFNGEIIWQFQVQLHIGRMQYIDYVWNQRKRYYFSGYFS